MTLSDVWHSNNAVLEMARADFFIAKISLIGLWSLLGSSNSLKRQNMWGVTSKFHIEKIGGKFVSNIFFFISFYLTGLQVNCLILIFGLCMNQTSLRSLPRLHCLMSVGWVMEQPLIKCH